MVYIRDIEVARQNIPYSQIYQLKFGVCKKHNESCYYSRFYFGLVMWIKKYMVIFIGGLVMDFKF